MRIRSGSGRSRRHIIDSGARDECRQLRSTPTNETNKHDKSSANVTANKITATTTTCCLDKHHHNSSIHAQLHHHQQKRQSGRHVAGHCRLERNNCDCHRARDNYSYKWPFSSSLDRGRYLEDAQSDGSNSIDTAHCRPLVSGQSRTLKCKLTCARVISSPLFLVLLALAHFHCHSTIITSSLAAPADSSYDSSRADSGAIARRASEEQSDGARGESWRAKPDALRDFRDARLDNVNMSNVFEVIFRKRPYSKYWTVEQKWDDLFKRMMAVEGTVRQMMMKNFMRDIEYYADLTISPQCEKDLKFIQNYAKHSTNMRWLAHMFDATGKSEPGMLTGMLAHLGHPVQCIKVRAPARVSNVTFDERFFEVQTKVLGERFRGKYCLASVRPVLPPKPAIVSRFSVVLNESLLSNISYTGESLQSVKMRARQLTVPARDHQLIDRHHLRLDQVPFESELYEYLIAQRNFMYSLPRFMGVCYPSSCTREDVRASLQKTLDEQHQVVDIEFECEQEEEENSWDWFITPRLLCYVLLTLLTAMVFLVSLIRYILLSKMQIRRSKLDPSSAMANLLNVLDMFSMDKCAGILFVKTRRASPIVDWTKVENNRSTAIDALRGFMMLLLVYSQMTLLGCLPLPFMWAKWSDEMFPFFRSILTQVFINAQIWSEAFYLISAYLIALKCFENFRPKICGNGNHPATTSTMPLPNMFSFAIKRYIRLMMPMLAFIMLNYLWPRMSNGFVFQDQSSRLMKPCDTSGWTNLMLFHNHFPINETCLWPSHVSATFFQLHLLSYPLLALCLSSLWIEFNDHYDNQGKLLRRRNMLIKMLTFGAFGLMAAIGLLAAVYAAWQASRESLIVPFLIDYIDYDNYQRVIEWMVLPTYNHATSYMVGIALAFIVIKRKAHNEMRQLERSAWFSASGGTPGHYIEREDSVDSVPSSSTHELRDGLTFKGTTTKFRISPTPSTCASSKRDHDDDDDDDDDAKTDATLVRRGRSSTFWTFCKSTLALLVLLLSLLTSWLWNGLGQPMSANQTFWYVLMTKISFLMTFAYLFHEHIAVRRNSSNPWMLTRFLVPIGRMSLTVFYVSWLVIWFDLLSSLYQWHPSHYFLFEKYNEIIFITLIVGMFVYGAFEGIIKRIQYASRLERVERESKSEERRAELLAKLEKCSALGESESSSKQLVLRQLLANNKRVVKPFESFFDSLDKAEMLAQDDQQLRTAASRQRRQSMAGDKAASRDSARVDLSMEPGQRAIDVERRRAGQSPSLSHSSSGFGNLSPGDRYKLNAELRANYSFASIGLYENAGATGDLSNLNTAAHDPQASPAMSLKR